MPSCDVVVIAGDVLPLGAERGFKAQAWMQTDFQPWLEELDCDHIVAIGGNHDFEFEADPASAKRLPWNYLCDSGCEIDGVKFWGSPRTPHLARWAFYGSPEVMKMAGEAVPEDTDVTIFHSPPDGYGNAGHPEWTDPATLDMIKRVRPKLHCSGHIHEGRGLFQFGPTQIVNCTIKDEYYDPVYEPMILDL